MSDHTSSPGTSVSPAAGPLRRVKVWDLPLRLFHWCLLLAVAVAITTAEIGGNWMELHGRAGLAVVGLLAFRLVWGLVGTATARFAQFAPTPARLKAYLSGRWQGLGHNPLGALSVFALLGLLAAQAGTGLFSNDEIAFTGPLNGLVEESFGLMLTGWHEDLAGLLFALLGLHVAAIVFHKLVKKHDLVKPMLTGWAEAGEAGAPEASDAPKAPRSRLFAAGGPLALLLALDAAGSAVWVASGGPWRVPAGAAPIPAVAPMSAETPSSAPASAPSSAAVPNW